MSRSGIGAGWARKSQWYVDSAERQSIASQTASVGRMSRTARRGTLAG